MLGPARTLVMSPEERERVAYHEGGHALLGLLVPGADPVNRVTIVPRGRRSASPTSGPRTIATTTASSTCARASSARWAAGRPRRSSSATRTTGAENDMQQATELARQMVTRWGMSERLGPVTLAPRDGPFLARPGRLRLRRRQAVQRGDRRGDRRRGPADPGGALRRSEPLAARAPTRAGSRWPRRCSSTRRWTKRHPSRDRTAQRPQPDASATSRRRGVHEPTDTRRDEQMSSQPAPSLPDWQQGQSL